VSRFFYIFSSPTPKEKKKNPPLLKKKIKILWGGVKNFWGIKKRGGVFFFFFFSPPQRKIFLPSFLGGEPLFCWAETHSRGLKGGGQKFHQIFFNSPNNPHNGVEFFLKRGAGPFFFF
jgi:hypothetical protein